MSAALSILETIKKEPALMLGLKVGPHQTIEPGQLVKKEDATAIPELVFPAADPTKTYCAVCLDFDAPLAPLSFLLSPINHWTQSGFKADATGKLSSTDATIVDYAPPGPPPVGKPHRYAFYLLEQPSDFDPKAHALPEGQKVGLMTRVKTRMEALQAKYKLGDIVAANYFVSQ